MIKKITVPKVVTLTETAPTRRSRITVQVQNRGDEAVEIPDVETYRDLVRVDVRSRGNCLPPSAIVRYNKP